MRYGRFMAAFTVMAALGFGAAAETEAQQVPVPQEEQIEVTTELLERFVGVYPAVMGIAQSAQAQLATAESPEDAHAIQAEAQQQITATLDEADFTVAEYEAVVAVLNQDEELRNEFQALLEAAMEDGQVR